MLKDQRSHPVVLTSSESSDRKGDPVSTNPQSNTSFSCPLQPYIRLSAQIQQIQKLTITQILFIVLSIPFSV